MLYENEFRLIRVGFADSIKEAVSVIYNIPLPALSDSKLKEEVISYLGKSPRTILQEVGTKLRELDPDIWVKSALGKGGKKFIEAHREAKISRFDEIQPRGLVISDVRYKNEAEHLKSIGGILIRIERPGREKLAEDNAKHASEVDLDNFTGWDYTLQNDQGLVELHDKATKLMFQIIAAKEKKHG